MAYDGTNYCGWQVQPNGVSIQSTLQKAIENLLGEKTDVTGASRTDSGVHALGQVAVFDTDKNIPDWKYALAINQRLPKDIVVQKSEEVPLDFHPRYTDVEKTYEYRILNRRTQLPKERLYSYFVPKKLNVDKMREAGVYLVGEHDFKSFCSQKTKVLSTVRTIYSLELIEEGDIVTLRVSGNGFLYNMVRIIAGVLIKVGLEQKEPEEWDIAVHRYDVKTNAGAVLETGFTGFSALRNADAMPEGAYVEDVWTTAKIAIDMSGMMDGNIVYMESYYNEELSKWLNVDKSNMPPTYTLSNKVYMVKLKDGTYAAVRLTNYMNASGVKGFMTIDYIYPFEL